MGGPIARPSRDGGVVQGRAAGAVGRGAPTLRIKCGFCQTINDFSIAGNRAVATGAQRAGEIPANLPSQSHPPPRRTAPPGSPKATVDMDALDCSSIRCAGCGRICLANGVSLWQCGNCHRLYLGRDAPVQGNLIGICPWCAKPVRWFGDTIGKVEVDGKSVALPGPSRVPLPGPPKQLPP